MCNRILSAHYNVQDREKETESNGWGHSASYMRHKITFYDSVGLKWTIVGDKYFNVIRQFLSSQKYEALLEIRV